MSSKSILIYLLSVFIASVSQVLLKVSANRKYDNKIKEYFNKYVVIAYIIFITSTLLTVIAYKGIELKTGPIIEASGYVFILVLGNIFLNEKITSNKLIGNVLIIIGIVVFTL